MTRPILLSGCSGGGKTTLLNALAAQGFATIPEPGHRIVALGQHLPWVDPVAFAQAAIAMALADLDAVRDLPGPVFADRGLVDAVLGYRHASGKNDQDRLLRQRHYDSRVLLVPPWPEIYVQDEERQHGFEAAEAEYHRLNEGFRGLGYDTHVLPKAPVQTRVQSVIDLLGL